MVVDVNDTVVIHAFSQKDAYIKGIKWVVENCDTDPRIFLQVNNKLQGVTRAIVHNMEFIITGNAAANDINLSDLAFVAKTRWRTFLDDYFEKTRFPDFVNQWLFEPKLNSQPGYVCVESGKHTMGGCLIGLSGHFLDKARDRHPELVVHSRSTMFAPVAGLDLSLGGALMNYAERVTDYPFNEAVHRWKVDMSQFVNWMLCSQDYFFNIYHTDDSYPDTTLGESMRTCMNFAKNDDHPPLKMLSRHTEKVYRHMTTGTFNASGKEVEEFYAFLPTSYLPNDEVI